MSKSEKKRKSKIDDQDLHKQLLRLWNRAQSDLCEVRGSSIHGRGVYAIRDITTDERIIEYVGELINKDESGKRGTVQHERSIKSGDAAVYIFNLTDKYDLDGNVPWNTARLINHSCEPNCEAWMTGKRIFIHALRDIKEGEELTFDYGFDVECYEEHPCLCGRDGCVGYIVSREQWSILEEKLGRGNHAEKVS
jgi:SET domain-containing protein